MSSQHRRIREARFPYDALGMGGSTIRSVQPDQEQFSDLRQAMINGMLPFNCIIELLQTKNSPPQVQQNAYTCRLNAVNSPVLLIPNNVKRMGFLVCNTTASTIFFSYDWPKSVIVNGVTTLVGIPIVTASYFLESNGLASINDIYVWSSDTTSGHYPQDIGGFEAVITISPQNTIPGINR